MAALVLLAALAATATATPADSPREARLLNVQELVTANDYPLVSVEKEQQGTVTVRVKIGPDGFVSSCKVTKSSGHPPLDEQTCALLRARGRFDPATDRRGRAIASNFTQQMTWKLQDMEVDPPLPRQAWMMRGTVSLDRHGKIVDCALSSTGFGSEPLFCRPILEIARIESASTARPPGVVAAFSITDSYFLPAAADKVTIPPELPGAEKIAQQVSEVVIEPDGQISGCKGVRYSGAAGPETDACRLLTNARFVPAEAGGARLTGTIVMTVYLQKHSVT